MSDATVVPGLDLSTALGANLVNRFPALRATRTPNLPLASTSALPINPATTIKELGNGVGGGGRKRGRTDDDIHELIRAEEREQQQLIGYLNQAVVELGPIKPGPHPTTTTDMRLTLLRHEEYLLKAELAALRQATRPLPTSNSGVADPTEASLAALDRTIAELELANARADNSLARERQLVAKDEVLMTDAVTLNEALHAYLEAKRAQAGDNSPDHLLARTQARANRITAAFGSLMAALVQLIDERLAAPGLQGDENRSDAGGEGDSGESDDDDDSADEEERKDRRRRRYARRKQTKRLGILDSTSIQAYFSAGIEPEDGPTSSAGVPSSPADKAMALKQLLENLMNAAVGAKPDSWLRVRAPPGSLPEEVAKYFPSELVDFLLRAGVIIEKAGDQAKVKLVDFGKTGTEDEP